MENKHPSIFQESINNSSVDNIKKNVIQRVITSDKDKLKEVLLNIDLKKSGGYILTPRTKVENHNNKSLLEGIQEESLLSYLYFSNDNIHNLQNVAKHILYLKTGFVIDNQDITNLLLIMRSTFLEYALHPQEINEKMPIELKNKILKENTKEIQRLNDITINEIVPILKTQIEQYIFYLRDSNSRYVNELPQLGRVQKQLRSVTNVLTGDVL